MTQAENYFKKAKDAIRRGEGQPVEQVAGDIRDVLFLALGELPDNLKHDVFNFYFEQYLLDEDANKTLYKLAEAPMNLINFMVGQVTTEEVDFSEEEWEMIREGINANADSMDIRLLNRLMTILVEKKRY